MTGAVQIVGTLAGNIDADFLVDIKTACIPTVIAAVGNALEDFEASVSASGSIIASL